MGREQGPVEGLEGAEEADGPAPGEAANVGEDGGGAGRGRVAD